MLLGMIGDIKLKRKSFTSPHNGVCFSKLKNKWLSYYGSRLLKKHIGSFCTEEEAYAALCKYKNDNNLL